MTRRRPTDALDLAGPTARELAAIEAEWPGLAAGLAEVDREIAEILAAEAGQGWFWTEQWQAGEREASGQIAAGGLTVYDDMTALFADLDAMELAS